MGWAEIHYGDGKHLANLTVEDADRIAKVGVFTTH